MSYWSIRLLLAAMSKAPLPTIPVLPSLSNVSVNFEKREHARIKFDQNF